MEELRCEKDRIEPETARMWPMLFPHLNLRRGKGDQSPMLDSNPGSPPNTPHEVEAPALPPKEPIV